MTWLTKLFDKLIDKCDSDTYRRNVIVGQLFVVASYLIIRVVMLFSDAFVLELIGSFLFGSMMGCIIIDVLVIMMYMTENKFLEKENKMLVKNVEKRDITVNYLKSENKKLTIQLKSKKTANKNLRKKLINQK